MQIYCHGLPGGPSDRVFLGQGNELTILDPLHRPGTHRQAVLEAYDAQACNKDVHVTGFSLGAIDALTIAAERTVASVTLISAAAPLDMGRFLPDMAGATVFRSAQQGSLKALCMTQAVALRLWPGGVVAGMFLSAAPAERALIRAGGTRRAIISGLRHCLHAQRPGYIRAIHAYVAMSGNGLPSLTCPLTLHHGTEDRWAPMAMSQALTQAMGGTLIQHDGLGHYGTLQAATSAKTPSIH